MAIYGITVYGTDTYGLSLPPAYLNAPMAATPVDYTQILITWKQPSGIMFRYRLISNRYGYPVDENDGDIIYDSEEYPGSHYLDQNVIPGTYHYYGFYVLVDLGDNIWIRSGLAACLAPFPYGYGQWMMDHLPEYYRMNPSNGDALTDDINGNSQLQNMLNVLGWAADYLQTQYDALANHVNDPSFIPLDDLWNMAAEVGLKFSPEVPAYTVRKAVVNQAHVSQKRGTLQGLAEEINIRTGWGADCQMGNNIVLDDDQGQFLGPIYLPYDPQRVYHSHEIVWFSEEIGDQWNNNNYFRQAWTANGWWYQNVVEGTVGINPPGDGSSNANWTVVRDQDDFKYTLSNPNTGTASTWEVLDSTASNGLPLPGTATQGLGVKLPNAPDTHHNSWNSFRLYNLHGSPNNFWARSVSRRYTELCQIPDPGFEVGQAFAPKERQSLDSWVPHDWPRRTIDNYLGGHYDIPLAEYWTPYGCHIEPSRDFCHGGFWSCKVVADFNTANEPEQLVDPGFEQSVNGWIPANCIVSRSSSVAHSGSYSMAITPEAVSNPNVTSPQVTAEPNVAVTMTAWVQPAAGTSTTSLHASVVFYDDVGVTIAQTNEGTQSCSAGAWYELTVSATAPDNASTMALIITYDEQPATTEIVFVDDITFSYGSPANNDCHTDSPWSKVGPDNNCVGTIWVYAPQAISTTICAAIQWFDQAGQEISRAQGTSSSPTVSGWKQYTVTAPSPVNCVYASLALVYTNPVSEDTVYIDDTQLTATLDLNAEFPPQQIAAIEDGIPVPFTRPSQEWEPTTSYKTNDLVVYENKPFKALRASTGATPSPANVATSEWAPLSQNERIRLMVSGYTGQNLTTSTNYTADVIPFVEWFDQFGSFIARVFARNPNLSGAVSRPNNMTFDSFTGLSVVNGAINSSINLTNWNASYYSNTTLSGTPFQTAQYSSLNQSYGNQAPFPAMPVTGWSSSYTTAFLAPATGVYTFTYTTDGGGSRLFVNGTLLINNWTSETNGTLTQTMNLTAGQLITMELDFFKPFEGWGAYGTNELAQFQADLAGLGLNADTVQSAAVPVTPGAKYQFSITLDGGAHDGIQSSQYTVAFYDGNGHPVSTFGQSYSGGTTTLTNAGFAPSNATSMTATVTGYLNAHSQPGMMIDAISYEEAQPVITTNGVVQASTVASPSSAVGVTNNLLGRSTDDGQGFWIVPAGAFEVGGFEGGTVWPDDPTVRSIALIAGTANTYLGVTFRSATTSGNTHGIIFRYTDTNNYWRCGATSLRKKVAGVWSTVATHSTHFSTNDRMNIILNGSSIQVFRNNAPVSSATDAFNSTATYHGICNEPT